MFVPGRPFQPSLFVSKAGAYPSKAPFKLSTQGLAPDLLTNIRLGWKSPPGTNARTYYEHSSIMDIEGFMTLGSGANVIKHFTVVKSYMILAPGLYRHLS